MGKTLRRSMAELHTWTGLLLGWLMFAMFTTGTGAYFQHEITRWMEPEIVAPGAAQSTAAAHAADYLKRVASDADWWFVALPDERQVRSEVRWRGGEGDPSPQSRLLDGRGEAVAVRDTRGGYFLYRFHFDLHYLPARWARYLVGIAAMSMLVAILSGVITHKKIFTRFFSLSLRKGLLSWYDAHNMASIFALPFVVMITYTGLVTLAHQYMPFGGLANFSDRSTYFATTFPRPQAAEPSGEGAELASLAEIVGRARATWGGAPVATLEVQHPGDAEALVHVRRDSAATVGTRVPVLSYRGATGEPVGETRRYGGAYATESVLVGVHAGRFAPIALRWLYFLCGVLGIVMIGTGLVQWTARRRKRLPDPERPHFGFRLVERLNISAIAGLGAALAGYFLANRLLPLALPARSDWEVHSFFLAWGAVTLWATVRPARRAWTETLAAAALLFAAIPLVNGLSTDRGLLTSLRTGDWVFAGFDLVMLLLAAAYGTAARISSRGTAAVAERPRAPSGGVPSKAGS
ncbi:MAG: PepSY-associated TM helix domain-containing protein [Acidobacteriota bacterium]